MTTNDEEQLQKSLKTKTKAATKQLEIFRKDYINDYKNHLSRLKTTKNEMTRNYTKMTTTNLLI